MATQLGLFPIPANGVLTVEGGRFLANTSAGPVSIYLPHGSSPGLSFFIYDAMGNAGTNSITIRSVIGSLINGAATLVISTNWASVEIFSNGAGGFFATTFGASSGGASAATAPAFGTGSPEGVVTGDPGKVYANSAGELWIKETGTGNTGWVKYIG